jgi:Cu2+-exporting ATPase
MECEGDKVYFVQENVAQFVICTVFRLRKKKLEVEVEVESIIKPRIIESTQRRKILLPMFCEGDKTYPENVGCPFVEWIW